MFLLDTLFIIQLLRDPEKVKGHLSEIDREGTALSATSYYEIFIRRARMSRKEIAVLTRFFRSL